MKSLMKSFVACAALCGFAAVGSAADWTYADGKITEVVTDGATPWVLNVADSSLGEGLRVGGSSSFGNAVASVGSHETIDLSGTVSDGTTVYTIVEIGGQSFRGRTDFTGVVLPETLRKIVNGAFCQCSRLSSVTPMLPDSLEYLGAHAFTGCSALKVDVVLRNKDLELPEYSPDFNYNTFTSSGILSVDLSESGVTQTPLAFVRACPNLKWVKYPKTLVAVGGGSHYGCSSLMEIQFNSFPTWGGDVFGSTPAYSTGSRITYPANNPDWLDYVTRKTGLTLWANASTANQNTYNQAFPDGPTPVGYAMVATSDPASSSSYSGSKWLVPIESETSTCELAVTGDPGLKIGSVTPNYGNVGTVDEPVAFSVANECAINGDQVYRCLGYKIGKLNGTDVEYGELVEELSGTFDPAGKNGNYYICWVWELEAHRVAFQAFPTHLGVVAIDEPCFRDFTGFYPVGQPITVRATPADGVVFERWYNDVPAGRGADNPLVLTIDAPKTILPYFSGKWVLNDDANPTSMTDGYWTFPVSGTRDALSVGRTSAGLATLVDLRKGVEGGGTITAIAEAWFSGSAAVAEVRFPDTMKVVPKDAFRQCSSIQKVILPSKVEAIGNAAFYYCQNLTNVEPLLPHSVTSIESSAFCDCPQLTGDLVLSNPRLWLEGANATGTGDYSTFRASGFLSVDLARTRLEVPLNAMFRQCPNLTCVKFPKTLKQLSDYGMFYYCSKLKDIQFRSWLTDFGTAHTDAFGGTPSGYGARIVYPKGDPGWAAYIEELKASNNFTAWEDAGNNTNTYLSAFPDGWKPVGYSIIHKGKPYGNVGKWLVPRSFGVGTMVIVR